MKSSCCSDVGSGGELVWTVSVTGPGGGFASEVSVEWSGGKLTWGVRDVSSVGSLLLGDCDTKSPSGWSSVAGSVVVGFVVGLVVFNGWESSVMP